MNNNDLYNITYNPDVLNCLANLSNDEVMTPPEVVNKMLDQFPEELWEDKNATFLDPACKSGVFLREIAKRLMKGLEREIVDEQERRDHIFHKQLYGIAITELTSLLSRRSIYCSKTANGKYSISQFDNPFGNIRYEHLEHLWKDGKCLFCGGTRLEYDCYEGLETHAYEWIHTERPKEIFDMKFDVIIGNPPYQLSDGGSKASAKPIYHLFVNQAKKLNPRYMTLIIPSRWFSGGKGLDEFRDEMLNDKRIRRVTDFFDSTDCFPGVDISGGICYFLWDRDNEGECEVISYRGGKQSKMMRPLLEDGDDTFIRFNEAINPLRKISERNEPLLYEGISSRKPFGLDTKPPIYQKKTSDSIRVYAYPSNGYIDRKEVKRNTEWINCYKVCVSYAYGERGSFPYFVIGKPFIAEPDSCCTETYLVISTFDNETQAENLISYMTTKFFRFLVLLKKNTQHATRTVYSFVPLQDFNESWTDDKLYKKYDLSEGEIEFIESMIKPMEL